MVLEEGATVDLPELVPSNRPGHTEDRETLLVYGFAHEADFSLFRPPAGAIDVTQTDAYVAQLQERLDGGEVPRQRWVSAEFTYVIRAH